MFFDHIPSSHSITAKVLAYADDIITFNHNTVDTSLVLSHSRDFGNLSGCYLNHSKTTCYLHPSIPRSSIYFISEEIQIASLLANPIYLGMPLLHYDWESKLFSLSKKLKKILFMDLPLTMRSMGINTYIYSTIYFIDQHHPIPDALLTEYSEKFLATLNTYSPIPFGFETNFNLKYG
ncbi:hypothetical protein CANARDRAFT_30770 [[Candida] arabinofermentans NRRL YB-2248]|uniref:Reverse transcriptase domain-containing protein n=1 Tax=[Candida] arabinofermentans NRRL YB-2248 TaxID=983967 RepID=A0A1E4SSM5_9ASCO|nr:hypothetical protein CANARDRAFT_30770 [[Candida] arabinofermentans NRRL YB-2248]